MERTKNRPLVQGLIDPQISLIYASVLGGIAGVVLLYVAANPLAMFIACIRLYYLCWGI